MNARGLAARAARQPLLSVGTLGLVAIIAVTLGTALGNSSEDGGGADLTFTRTPVPAIASSDDTTPVPSTLAPAVSVSQTASVPTPPTIAPTATPVPSPTPILPRNVKDFGARGDGVADDTAAINKALADAPWVVIFPAGDYRLTGELRPRSGQELRFEPDARLVQYANENILHLQGVQNVTIIGAVLHHTGNTHPGGKSNIRVSGSSYLQFFDIVVERSDGWAFYIKHDDEFGDSHDILIDGYRNTNRDFQNTNIDDGLDIIGYNITVRRFDIATNDDAISLKAYGSQETYNVTIESGVIRSRDGGLTFGTEIGPGGVHDVTVRDVTFHNVGVPLYFKAYEIGYAGEVYNVYMQNITATGGAQRFLFFHAVSERANKFHNITLDGATFSGPAEFDCIFIQRQRDITLRNVVCKGLGLGAEVDGLDLQDVSNSRFENVTIEGFLTRVRLRGSGTAGNLFAGIPSDWVVVVDGASLGAQTFTAAPVN